MKTFKKALAVVLCVVMTLTAASLGGFVFEVEAATISSYSINDIVEFGWYPQSKVTDSEIIAALDSAGGEWISYGYYSGTTGYTDGSMTPGDYMRYKDVVYGSDKYRGVVFDSYRPYCTHDICSAEESLQDDNRYYKGHVYWFKYEPIKWKVINPETGMVLANTIIDAQPYQNYLLFNGKDGMDRQACWGSAAKTHYANNYAESSIRKWLNEDFYNTAFSIEQQNIIGYTTLNNYGTNSVYDSEETTDKIYLASYFNTYSGNGNLLMAQSRRKAEATAYAKVQGVLVDSRFGFSPWWLRTPGYDSSSAWHIDDSGFCGNAAIVNATLGIRPAFNFNLKSEIFQSDIVHIPGEWETVKESNCKVVGEKVQKCTTCGEVLKTEVIPRKDHISGEWETTLEPTIQADGKKVKKCTACGDILEEKIIPKIRIETAVDEKTGVKIDYIADNYNGVVEITVKESFNGTAFDIIDTAINSTQKFIYDMTMTVDGIVTQPQGKVTVKIPLPAGFDPTRTFVYLVNSETGKLESMKAKFVDGYMVFETTHFDFCALVEVFNCEIRIKQPSVTTVNYGDTLVLHADLGETALLEGYSILWTVEGTGVNISSSEDGMTCSITSVQSGNVTVKATVVDKNGEPILDVDNNEITAEQQLTSKAGFFQKLASFFKNLFGISRIILQSI